MLDKLKSFLSGAHTTIESPEDLAPGRVVLRGKIRATTPLTSPVLGQPCAAFYYRATYMAASRLKGYIRQKLRDALVYADELTLDFEGVPIRVRPASSHDFARSDHQALKERGYEGFEGREQRVAQGATVLATGTLKSKEGGWELALTSLENVEAQEPAKSRSAADKPSRARARGKKGKGRG